MINQVTLVGRLTKEPELKMDHGRQGCFEFNPGFKSVW